MIERGILVIARIIFICYFVGFCSTTIKANVLDEPVSKTLAFNEVTAMFSDNLTTTDELLGDLLLAIAFDHTASNAPAEIKHIGIPYILEKGIKYWAIQLQYPEPSLDAIVNNALFLLFSKERTEEAKKAALKLMQIAANHNYWPAKFYVAEHNLRNYLSVDYGVNPSLEIKDVQLADAARITMEYYNDCAKRGFAPCQYRVGTWLVANGESVEDGLSALQQAIKTSTDDPRYRDMFVQRRAHAAQIINGAVSDE